jgi:hypothetical protein
MFSHIITFGSSLPEARGGHSLCAIICERVLIPEKRQQQLKFQRDPQPHNGIAKTLFAGDLVTARTGQLSHAHEELEKELLSIGEHLDLRGPDIDAQHATVLATAQEELATLALSDLESMTMTVLDGDFERKVIAAENVYFTKFAMPADENDARHYNARFLGSISPIPATVPTAVAMLHPAHGQLILQNVATDPAVIRARMKVAGLLIGAALVGGIWLYRRGRGPVVGAILICCCLSESTAQDDTTPQLSNSRCHKFSRCCPSFINHQTDRGQSIASRRKGQPRFPHCYKLSDRHSELKTAAGRLFA